jgi:hypothetical protein
MPGGPFPQPPSTNSCVHVVCAGDIAIVPISGDRGRGWLLLSPKRERTESLRFRRERGGATVCGIAALPTLRRVKSSSLSLRLPTGTSAPIARAIEIADVLAGPAAVQNERHRPAPASVGSGGQNRTPEHQIGLRACPCFPLTSQFVSISFASCG